VTATISRSMSTGLLGISFFNPNRSRRKAEFKRAIEEVDCQRQVLEGEAVEARVPIQWRD
jgi:hypothetical protein